MSLTSVTLTAPQKFTQTIITVPGSKYLANRLLVIACLAEGITTLRNLPENEDITVAGKGMEQLGANIERQGNDWIVHGTGGKLQVRGEIYSGENGTFSRFIVSLVSLANTPVMIDSAPRMKERPMREIIEALTALGVKIESYDFSFPLKITGPLYTGEISLKGDVSSQYFSSLLLALPYAKPREHGKNHSILYSSTPMVSKHYLTLTTELMSRFGVVAKTFPDVVNEVDSQGSRIYEKMMVPIQPYQACEYVLEPDPVSSTYFMGLAALSKKSFVIKDYNIHSIQGEVGFLKVLDQMGCRIKKLTKEKDGITGIEITPPCLYTSSKNKLQGITIDMSHMPDAVQTLAVLAAHAQGKTRITGISHLRFKESNRVEDTAQELRKTGITVVTGEDFIEIEGGEPHSAEFESHNDHRMVMSLSLFSIQCTSITINNYRAVAKSFPSFFDKLQELGFGVEYT